MEKQRTCLASALGFFLAFGAYAADASGSFPCDIKVTDTTFGPHFKETDVVSVITAFRKLKPKDEFETTAAFKTRQTKDVAGIANPLQCVSVSPYSTSTEYDADHQKMNVGIESWPDGYGDTEGLRFELMSRVISKDSYIGSNAFGVSKAIEKTRREQYGVFFDKGSYLGGLRKVGAKPDSKLGLSYTIGFSLASEKARASEENLRILLIYSWIPKYMVEGFKFHSPTINEPYESRTNQYYLRAKLMKVVVFDKKTGDIFFNKSVGN